MGRPYAVITQLAVVNQSTVVSDVDGNTMTSALSSLLSTFCNDWNLAPVSTTYIAKGKTAPATSNKIYLLDTSDVQGALGYHDIVSDIPYAKVFAKTILNYGGVVLYDSAKVKPTVAQCLSHEAFEMLVDPRCTDWWLNPATGVLFAGEVGDPVESNTVVVTLPPNVKVGMSDWILPAWKDIQSVGPYNHLNTLTAPYKVDKNGYVMIIRNGVYNYVFGSTVSDSIKYSLTNSLRKAARKDSYKGPMAPMPSAAPK